MRFLLIIGIIWHVVNADSLTDEEFNCDDQDSIIRSANAFSSKFVTANVKNVSRSQILSPVSVFVALSMVTFGAKGNTKKQLRTTLGLPDNYASTGKKEFQTLIDGLNNYKDVELRLASKIFLADFFEPKTNFKNVTSTIFRSSVDSVNFVDALKASKTMNDWSESKTNNRVKDLIKPDDLDSYTLMVLLNAVYFKGSWVSTFNPKETMPRPFYYEGHKSKNIPIMYRFGSYRYGRLPDVKARFIEIPYKSQGLNDTVSMFVILPTTLDGLPELERNMKKITVDKLLSTGTIRKVELFLPKFKIESEINLDESLKKMGLTDMFSDQANFTGIDDKVPIKVSKIVQKAFVEVSEEGSESSASTAAIFHSRTAPNEDDPETIILFYANRPFISIIATTSETRIVLFTARYTSM